MDTITRYRPGQRVKVINTDKFTGLGTVVKHLQKNVRVRMDSGQEVRFDPFYLTTDLDAASPAAVVTTFVMPQVIGSIVKVSDRLRARNPKLAGLWVVVGDQGGKTRICKIGGDGGRYWRVPNEDVVKVDVPNTVSGFVGH